MPLLQQEGSDWSTAGGGEGRGGERRMGGGREEKSGVIGQSLLRAK